MYVDLYIHIYSSTTHTSFFSTESDLASISNIADLDTSRSKWYRHHHGQVLSSRIDNFMSSNITWPAGQPFHPKSCRSTEISCRCLNDDMQNLSSELEFTDTKVCQRIIQRSLCSGGRFEDRCELAMLMSNDIARRACSDGWFSIRCWDLVGAWYIFSNRVVRRCSTI